MKLPDSIMRWVNRPAASGKADAPWWHICCLARGGEDEDDPERQVLKANTQEIERADRRGSKVMRTRMFSMHGTSQQLHDSWVMDKKVIGRGGFGTVRRAHLKDNPSIVRAVKEVRKKTPRLETSVHREIAVTRRLDHPNICRLFETFEDRKCIYMVLEFIEGRELFDELQEEILNGQRFDDHRAACIMHQVFSALQYCHDHDVIHRDLKPENVMVLRQPEGADASTPVVKIIDFGLAVLSAPSGYRSRHFEGTEAYLAPEAKKGSYSAVSDVFSAGVILHIILLGCFPQGRAGVVAEGKELAGPARELLLGLLQPEPERRLTAAQAMQHAWTRGNYERSPQRKPSLGHIGDLSGAMSSFVDFCKSRKLHKAALTAMTTQLSNEHMERLREQFDLMDTDGNGVITKDELLEAVKQVPPAGVTDLEAWVQSTFDELDTDGSGELEFTEWQAAALRSVVGVSEEAIRAAFQMLDSDNTGSISIPNLVRVIQHSPDELQECLQEFDQNGDGVIDYEEFRAMFLTPGRASAKEGPAA